MRLLVHACCAPCSIPAMRHLAADAVHYLYFNPNIHPFREYRERLDAWLRLMQEEGISHRTLEYEPEAWIRAVSWHEEDRCELCYRLRLGQAAEVAAAEGYQALSTTLFASPYQNHALLKQEGEAAAGRAGLRFVVWDGSSEYQSARASAKARGLYTQSYCGCLLSERERYDKSRRRPLST